MISRDHGDLFLFSFQWRPEKIRAIVLGWGSILSSGSNFIVSVIWCQSFKNNHFHSIYLVQKY